MQEGRRGRRRAHLRYRNHHSHPRRDATCGGVIWRDGGTDCLRRGPVWCETFASCGHLRRVTREGWSRTCTARPLLPPSLARPPRRSTTIPLTATKSSWHVAEGPHVPSVHTCLTPLPAAVREADDASAKAAAPLSRSCASSSGARAHTAGSEAESARRLSTAPASAWIAGGSSTELASSRWPDSSAPERASAVAFTAVPAGQGRLRWRRAALRRPRGCTKMAEAPGASPVQLAKVTFASESDPNGSMLTGAKDVAAVVVRIDVADERGSIAGRRGALADGTSSVARSIGAWIGSATDGPETAERRAVCTATREAEGGAAERGKAWATDVTLRLMRGRMPAALVAGTGRCACMRVAASAASALSGAL
eukprot:scaffold240353_cov27-Tisochrysis_lutea.AAC.3